MSGHTPGPWVACFEIFCGVKRAFHIAGKPHGSSRPIASFSNDDWRGVDVPEDVIEANGRLLAAAPEMLEALKAIAEETRRRQLPVTSAVNDLAVAAIAKAEGRS